MHEDFSSQRVVEKVIENGEVLRDIDYSTIRHGPNQFIVQGFNRSVPFVITNMSPQSLRSKYGKKNKKSKKTQKSKSKNKGFKKKTSTRKKK